MARWPKGLQELHLSHGQLGGPGIAHYYGDWEMQVPQLLPSLKRLRISCLDFSHLADKVNRLSRLPLTHLAANRVRVEHTSSMLKEVADALPTLEGLVAYV